MKTIYLIGWLTSAIGLAIYAPNFKQVAILYVFNFLIPTVLLVIRIAMLHIMDEKEVPL